VTIRRNASGNETKFTCQKADLGKSGASNGNRTLDLDETAGMELFKPNFYRFFVVGFAVGAVLVVATTDGSAGSQLREGIMPVADAASTE
jgi:hypothetical protein